MSEDTTRYAIYRIADSGVDLLGIFGPPDAIREGVEAMKADQEKA